MIFIIFTELNCSTSSAFFLSFFSVLFLSFSLIFHFLSVVVVASNFSYCLIKKKKKKKSRVICSNVFFVVVVVFLQLW